jgi:hypothetical protein
MQPSVAAIGASLYAIQVQQIEGWCPKPCIHPVKIHSYVLCSGKNKSISLLWHIRSERAAESVLTRTMHDW